MTQIDGRSASRLVMPKDDDPEQRMCCVGQMCVQLGIDKSSLEDISVISSRQLDAEALGSLDPLLDGGYEREWVRDAYGTNDDTTITDAEREARLQNLAKSVGHTIQFIN